MKVFMVMPFAKEFDELYEMVRGTCKELQIDVQRADEINQPGPIINQIFVTIGQADAIIGEVSTRNPNVFYEIAIAHCEGIPSILLAQEDAVNQLPFDIQHNRVLLYRKGDIGSLKNRLHEALVYIRDVVERGKKPDEKDYVHDLSRGQQITTEGFFEASRMEIASHHGLVPPIVEETREQSNGGWVITVRDAFKKRITYKLDANGISKLVTH